MKDKQTFVKVVDNYTATNVPMSILSSDRPLVLKGFAKAWPGVEQTGVSVTAATEALMAYYNQNPVKASYLPAKERGRVFYNADMSGFNFENKRENLQSVIEEIQNIGRQQRQEGIYVASTDLHTIMPELAKEIQSKSEAPENSIVNIWLGSRCRIAAHYDFAQNLACCIVGRRRFTLFPPEQIENLYPGPLHFAPGGQEISMVDFESPDFKQHPKFKHALAASQVAELEPGDALVLPSMWWHYVEGLDDLNILITHWWRDSPAYLGRPTNAMLHNILSIRDLPKTQRDAWKALFDYYVFNDDPKAYEHMPDHVKGFLTQPLNELDARKLRAELQNILRR